MINTHDNEWVPSEGYKYITNGSSYSESILLGRTDSIDNWHDTNDEPPSEEDEVEDAEALGILLGGVT